MLRQRNMGKVLRGRRDGKVGGDMVGGRVGRTEHHALPLLLYTGLDFFATTTVTNAGGLAAVAKSFAD